MQTRLSWLAPGIALWVCLTCVFTGLSQSLPDLAQIKVAAENGSPEAQDKLGQSYESHFNFSSAVEWYRKSAEQGSPHAQWKVGIMLLEGRPKMAEGTAIAKAPDEGVKWLMLSANQGLADAQADLARCYENGNGVKKDNVEAYKWYRIASQGSATLASVWLNPLILKMSQLQIQEGERRANNFKPHQSSKGELPDPQYAESIVLKSVSGTTERRFALINNQTLAKGETAQVKVGQKTVTIKCLEIKEKSVVVQIEGMDKAKELILK